MSNLGSSYGDGATTHFLSDLAVGVREENANALILKGSVAGQPVKITAEGDDTNISIVATPKGGGTAPTSAAGQSAPAEVANSGPASYTVEQLQAGVILRDPKGANRTDTLPAAAALADRKVLEFTLRNESDTTGTITVAPGVGGTASGTMTVKPDTVRRFLVVVKSPTAYTVYSLGSAAA